MSEPRAYKDVRTGEIYRVIRVVNVDDDDPRDSTLVIFRGEAWNSNWRARSMKTFFDLKFVEPIDYGRIGAATKFRLRFIGVVIAAVAAFVAAVDIFSHYR